jgi:ubiquitin-like protein Pup
MAEASGGEMAQEKIQRQSGGEDVEDVEGGGPAGQERREEQTEKIDDVLKDIDRALEDNAEDFVRAYVQKGGQ